MDEKACNWKDLLDNFIKSENKKIPEEQEKETTDLFFEYMDYNDNKGNTIPKFYFKKPINYNDLYFNVKTEAKNRFLSMKSYELPQKTRNLIYLLFFKIQFHLNINMNKLKINLCFI